LKRIPTTQRARRLRLQVQPRVRKWIRARRAAQVKPALLRQLELLLPRLLRRGGFLSLLGVILILVKNLDLFPIPICRAHAKDMAAARAAQLDALLTDPLVGEI